ncbi:MAG: NADH-quinone oxidoreductase subunit L [Coriobacteriales bacterium]|nr:NADH-quinone oxidoreductase subunit L [Coriobacteriales bacterium]
MASLSGLLVLSLVPAIVAALLPLLGRVSKGLVPVVALVGPALSLAYGVQGIARGHEAADVGGSYAWFATGPLQQLRVGWTMDNLAAIMLLVVGTVAACVVIFSIGYMKGDPGWSRYFALISLFVASMNTLVIADGFVTLFFGWELVGACSYLLIGFWYEKPSAVKAAIKAFLTTRVGDVGLLLGMAILLGATGSLQYAEVFMRVGALPASVVTAAAALVAVGAFGKSAQFPLQIWLPDAMEGPTPVSALIHAATMVAAGVYLIARTWPLFEVAPAAREFVLVIGTVSALGAALAAVAQRDIKKVLAYSTISQLGFMFAALGVGAWQVAMFHLVTHAAFKALLFLGAGSVIHGSGTQDLREMGGLRKAMPVTFVTWVIGSLALAGIFPFAGFFSKDEILTNVWHDAPIAAAALGITAFVTAFYVARSTRLAFFGEFRGEGHPHESPISMTGPLVLLAVLATTLGFAAEPFMELLEAPAEEFSMVIAATSMTVAVLGLLLGWTIVSRGASSDERLQSALGPAWSAAAAGWGWNALLVGFAGAVATGCRVVWAFGDRLIFDGAAEGTARLTRAVGGGLTKLQTGETQWYVALVVLAAAVALAWAVRAQ